MSPAPCSNDFLQNAPQSDYPINHLEALLSVIYPNGTADSKMMLPNNGDMMAMNGFYDSGLGSPAGLPKSMPPANNPLPPVQSTTYTSVYVKNVPADANDLWVYERFAPHGSILSVKVLHEEGTTRCRGVCFVNFTSPEGAMAAIQAMNGRKVGDKTLHVSIQTRR
jgi:RNA recognition motif-containing protein